VVSDAIVRVLTSPLLEQLGWLDHGFGTRHDGDWTPAAETARLRQVHSSIVVTANCAGDLGEGDALASNQPGVWAEIRTADCVPVLLADPVRRVVAAVHAGWRGSSEAITRRAVETMQRQYGSDPPDLIAAIGPAIGVCCYEVGPEVAVRFPGSVAEKGGRLRVDLANANREHLRQAGVAGNNIHNLARCTYCEPADFHSFRRDKGKHRMISAIRVRPR
jgi:YfiH family protein